MFEYYHPLRFLSGVVIQIASMISFSTGTSWGTMAILFPVVVPIAIAMGAGIEFAGGENYGILLGAISSVMSGAVLDRKSTRLNSSHVAISYAVFCLKKKTSQSDRAHPTH